MIYVSHLLCDEDMKEICGQYGAGVESIEFSISDNLDRLERKMEQYQKRLEQMGNPPLTLHGPFLDLNPASFDSQIRNGLTSVTRQESALEPKRSYIIQG